MAKNNTGGENDSGPGTGPVSNETGHAGEARAAGGRARGNAANLSREARIKGGQRSAQVQVRDEHGQFAGRAGGERNQQQRRGGDEEPGGSPPNR